MLFTVYCAIYISRNTPHIDLSEIGLANVTILNLRQNVYEAKLKLLTELTQGSFSFIKILEL